MDTIVNYTSIYLVSTEVAPGLPPETRYVFESTSAPNMKLLGYVVGPPNFPLGNSANCPAKLVRLAAAKERGLSWEPAKV